MNDLFNFYEQKIELEVLDGGFPSVGDYIEQLRAMDEEVRKPWEKRFISELEELDLIKEDAKALNLELKYRDEEFVVPEYIMDPQFR